MTVLLNKKELESAYLRGKVLARKNWPALGMLLMVPGLMTGSLADVRVANGADLHITYAPTTHLHEAMTVSVEITPLTMPKKFSIRLDPEVTRDFTIAGVSPLPLSSKSDIDGTTYQFLEKDAHGAIELTLIPHIVGTTKATLSYGKGTPVAFSLTTLP